MASYEEQRLVFRQVSRLIAELSGEVPVLWGSFGLNTLLGIFEAVGDIDLLVSDTILEGAEWQELCHWLERGGFKLTDLKEREFRQGEVRVAFAPVRVLRETLGIGRHQLGLITDGGATYRQLALAQYRCLYERFLADPERRGRKAEADRKRLELIEARLSAKEECNAGH